MAGVDPARLVFVDEAGAHTSTTRRHARAPRGRRAAGVVPRNRGRVTTLVASLTPEGMGPAMTVEGGTTTEVFVVYVGRVLAPALWPGQVVVVDNLAAHRGERVRELVEARGAELVNLAAYSPDLNPIEEAFSELKALLRTAAARTREALFEAVGRAAGGHGRRCPGVVRPLRLPGGRSSGVKTAVKSPTATWPRCGWR